jgi:hypothetical protein
MPYDGTQLNETAEHLIRAKHYIAFDRAIALAMETAL